MVKIEVKPEMCEEIKTKDHKHLLRVLMQGTVRDGSPTMNRLKYEERLLVWFEQICHFIESMGWKKRPRLLQFDLYLLDN
ncbi:hypothetical protein Bca101_096737 [Brassica carinata]